MEVREGTPKSNVQVSKTLSYILRHGATKEKLHIRPDGYVQLVQLLRRPKLVKLGANLETVMHVVHNDPKGRFGLATLEEDEPLRQRILNATENPLTNQEINNLKLKILDHKVFTNETIEANEFSNEVLEILFICAQQGHTEKTVDSLVSLDTSILNPQMDPATLEETAIKLMQSYPVHGTYYKVWPVIVESGGLKPMQRLHIHIASQVPDRYRSIIALESTTVNEPPVSQQTEVSGFRKSCDVLIFIDVLRATRDGKIPFWMSGNNVLLTTGLAGLLPIEYFKLAVHITNRETLKFKVLVKDGALI